MKDLSLVVLTCIDYQGYYYFLFFLGGGGGEGDAPHAIKLRVSKSFENEKV